MSKRSLAISMLFFLFFFPCFIFSSKVCLEDDCLESLSFNDLIFGESSSIPLTEVAFAGGNLDENYDPMCDEDDDVENAPSNFYPGDFEMPSPSVPISIPVSKNRLMNIRFFEDKSSPFCEAYKGKKTEEVILTRKIKAICFQWIRKLDENFSFDSEQEQNEFEKLAEENCEYKLLLRRDRSLIKLLGYMDELRKGVNFLLTSSLAEEEKKKIQNMLHENVKIIIDCQLWCQDVNCILGKMIKGGIYFQNFKNEKRMYETIKQKLFSWRWWFKEKLKGAGYPSTPHPLALEPLSVLREN